MKAQTTDIPLTGAEAIRKAQKDALIEYYDALAKDRAFWMRRSGYYYAEIRKFMRRLIPPGARVLEIGSGSGAILDAVRPARGVGVDFSPLMVDLARKNYPQYEFHVGDAEDLPIREKFDYIILSDLLVDLFDIWKAFRELGKVAGPRARVVITTNNVLWEPFIKIAEGLRLKVPQKYPKNWIGAEDLTQLLYLNGFESIVRGYRILAPKYLPILSPFANKWLAGLPVVSKLGFMEYAVARPLDEEERARAGRYAVSVVIPCKNEAGNIERAVLETPEMGAGTELIFVDGNSDDGTVEEIEKAAERHSRRPIRLIHQGDGRGKGDAVRKGFAAATGDVLMILDSDLTVDPSDLPKFYQALAEGKGEFINGARLIYPMEKRAMRFLNFLGNKFFGRLFSWLLDTRITDTLCGTKVLLKSEYKKIAENRDYFGDFDPFGDFDLLFGAARLGLKIVEIPVRYKERTYGVTKISRFRHGWLLLKMSVVAFRKLKLH